MAKTSPTHELRRMHALGKRALVRREQRKRQGKGVHGTLSSLGIRTENGKSRLYEARRFAELFNDRDLEWLCELRNSKGIPLSKSHLLQLLLVQTRSQRESLIRKWVKHAWSFRRLQMEVERIRPRRQYGGRTFAVPQSAREVLLITERMAASWLRWARVVGASRRRLSLGDTLPTQLRKTLTSATQSIEKLHRAIQDQPSGRNRQSEKRKR